MSNTKEESTKFFLDAAYVSLQNDNIPRAVRALYEALCNI